MKKGLVALLFLSLLVGCSTQEESFIGLAKAKELVNEQQTGEVIKATSKTDESSPYYEVEVADDTYICEYRVHAKSGEVTMQGKRQRKQVANNTPNTDNSNDNTNSEQQNQNAMQGNGKGQHHQNNKPEGTITMKEAQTIALEKVGGGTVVKSDCEYDDDYQTYVFEIEIMFGNIEYDIEIDAYTKAILSYKEDH